MKTTRNGVSQKVQEHIAENNIFQKGDKVLCALSGGADSVALLLLLKELTHKLEIEVFAAHLNHGIRGDEADRDESFCAQLCKELEVPFISEKVDAPAIAKERGNGLEEAARVLRYDFLERAQCELGCNKIATAHHADDNIETVLLHMIRGCALGGLKGISPVRGAIVRPLLGVRKQELEAYIKERGYSFVHDSTNDELDATRNYIRHKILPHIYKLNESADKTFMRMCTSISKDHAYIDAQAESVPENAKREMLSKLDEAVLSRYIKKLYERKTKKTALDHDSVQLVINAVKKGMTVKYAVQGNVTAYISASGIDFAKNKESDWISEYFDVVWGENLISPIGYRILITKDKNFALSFTNIYKPSTLTKVKNDKITDGERLCVTVRTRREGDSYIFGRMKRDVRRQLINAKIPVQKRDKLPVMCVGDEIFYVHGLRFADGYESKTEENAVYIAVAEI